MFKKGDVISKCKANPIYSDTDYDVKCRVLKTMYEEHQQNKNACRCILVVIIEEGHRMNNKFNYSVCADYFKSDKPKTLKELMVNAV